MAKLNLDYDAVSAQELLTILQETKLLVKDAAGNFVLASQEKDSPYKLSPDNRGRANAKLNDLLIRMGAPKIKDKRQRAKRLKEVETEFLTNVLQKVQNIHPILQTIMKDNSVITFNKKGVSDIEFVNFNASANVLNTGIGQVFTKEQKELGSNRYTYRPAILMADIRADLLALDLVRKNDADDTLRLNQKSQKNIAFADMLLIMSGDDAVKMQDMKKGLYKIDNNDRRVVLQKLVGALNDPAAAQFFNSVRNDKELTKDTDQSSMVFLNIHTPVRQVASIPALPSVTQTEAIFDTERDYDPAPMSKSWRQISLAKAAAFAAGVILGAGLLMNIFQSPKSKIALKSSESNIIHTKPVLAENADTANATAKKSASFLNKKTAAVVPPKIDPKAVLQKQAIIKPVEHARQNHSAKNNQTTAVSHPVAATDPDIGLNMRDIDRLDAAQAEENNDPVKLLFNPVTLHDKPTLANSFHTIDSVSLSVKNSAAKIMDMTTTGIELTQSNVVNQSVPSLSMWHTTHTGGSNMQLTYK